VSDPDCACLGCHARWELLLERVKILERHHLEEVDPNINEHESRLDAGDERIGDLESQVKSVVVTVDRLAGHLSVQGLTLERVSKGVERLVAHLLPEPR